MMKAICVLSLPSASSILGNGFFNTHFSVRSSTAVSSCWLALSNSPDDSVRFFLRASVLSPKVKAALEEALSRKAKLAEVQHAIQEEEKALQVIEKDQARMRDNMARVPQTSEAYKRYLKKFDDQETEIEKRREQITQYQKRAEEERKSYESFLLNLNVE